MKKATLVLNIFVFALILSAHVSNEEGIWKEFVTSLYNNTLTLEQIKSPYVAKEQLMEWLDIIKSRHTFDEMIAPPDIYEVDNKVHHLKTLTYKGDTTTYNFSFLFEDNKWYFSSMETILIRLDKISSLPTESFPDIPEERKALKREEIIISKEIRLWNFLADTNGKESAFNWFKDGGGFLVAATMHVPFVSPHKAFILYLCWYQSKLWGNPVKLVELEDEKAVVEMHSFYLYLYRATSHLKTQISSEDYRKLFETKWYDRAEKAGWRLKIEYKDDTCIFHFSRLKKSSSEHPDLAMKAALGEQTQWDEKGKYGVFPS